MKIIQIWNECWILGPGYETPEAEAPRPGCSVAQSALLLARVTTESANVPIAGPFMAAFSGSKLAIASTGDH